MIFEKVRDIICEQFDLEPDQVTENTLLKEDLDADSLDLVDFVMSFEDEFRLKSPKRKSATLKPSATS